MRVIVSGATGFIGRPLVEELCESGHQVGVFSRDAAAAKGRVPGAVDFYSWRDTAAPPPERAVRGADAVIHLAGESVQGRWTQAKRRAIRDSRVLSTKALVAAVALLPLAERPGVFICGSATGYYGARGEEELDERALPDDSFLSLVCQEWESAARGMEALGVRTVMIRTGIVLHRSGGALASMLPLFRARFGGPLGGGQQWWSWVHRDDVVGVIEMALENAECEGPVNAVAPAPVRQREFAAALGRALGRSARIPAPALALRIALGGFASELLASRRVVPRRALALGYGFRHSSLESALRG